jgi:hypothetical protein
MYAALLSLLHQSRATLLLVYLSPCVIEAAS